MKKGWKSAWPTLERLPRRNIEVPDPDALVAFISPIHGFNYPPVMLNFLIHFPKTEQGFADEYPRWNADWQMDPPGLTGIAFYFTALILKLKGYSIRAMFPVDLPSNWISVHPGLNDRTVKFLHARNQGKSVSLCPKSIGWWRRFPGCSRNHSGFPHFTDFIMGYYFIGRFFFAKTYYASADCNNCDLCIETCPVKAIKKVDNRPFWTFNCESCMHCMSNCPKRAIETAHGSILVISILSSLVFRVCFTAISGSCFSTSSILFRICTEFGIIPGDIGHLVLHHALRYAA